MISEIFTLSALVGILTAGIRLATPYLYAALGETIGQRSGVLNLGVEGQMLMGAFAAFYVSLTTGNLWLGLLAAAIVGAAVGALHGEEALPARWRRGLPGRTREDDDGRVFELLGQAETIFNTDT